MTFVFFTLIFILCSFITAFSLFINSCSPFCKLATTALSFAYLIMLSVPLLCYLSHTHGRLL